jgi:hypothetical protein
MPYYSLVLTDRSKNKLFSLASLFRLLQEPWQDTRSVTVLVKEMTFFRPARLEDSGLPVNVTAALGARYMLRT